MPVTQRIEDLAKDLREYAFILLDGEVEYTGDDAGEVAAAVEHAFLAAVEHLEDDYEIKYTVTCLPEEAPYLGHCFDSGDPDYDQERERRIEHELEVNPWAWCLAKVTASCGGYEASEYLGACAYESEEEFRQTESYTEMRGEAMTSLLATLASAAVHGNVARRVVAALARD